MVERMAADGFPVDWEQVRRLAAGGSVGRPHLGLALVEAGVAPDVESAFRTHLSARTPYYVRKADMDVFTALALIRGAGGCRGVRPPARRAPRPGRRRGGDLAMAAAGMSGLEADHPDHDAEDRARARALAPDLGLVATGSSDYHGTNKATALGACTTTPAAFEALFAHATARRPVTDETVA